LDPVLSGISRDCQKALPKSCPILVDQKQGIRATAKAETRCGFAWFRMVDLAVPLILVPKVTVYFRREEDN
jgi:hypothetical protein